MGSGRETTRAPKVGTYRMYLYLSYSDCFHGLGVSQWPPLFGSNDEVSATAIPWCGKPKGTLHLVMSLFTLQLSDSRDSSSSSSNAATGPANRAPQPRKYKLQDRACWVQRRST